MFPVFIILERKDKVSNMENKNLDAFKNVVETEKRRQMEEYTSKNAYILAVIKKQMSDKGIDICDEDIIDIIDTFLFLFFSKFHSSNGEDNCLDYFSVFKETLDDDGGDKMPQEVFMITPGIKVKMMVKNDKEAGNHES